MTISVLISCMHQKDTSIISRSNVRTNAVVINQCDRESTEKTIFTDANGQKHQLRFICTKERGLAKSRNKAIDNSEDDICLIMDDDETLYDNYESIITNSFQEYNDVDIIAFNVDRNKAKKYAKSPHNVGFLRALKISSVEICFRRKSINDNNIRFDIEMGSGTGHGAGEENAFLYECLRKGLKIKYVPQKIATLSTASDSQWFNGFTEKYFLQRGWATERYMGKCIATLYAVYYIVCKRNMYKKDCSQWNALKHTLKGIYCKNIWHETSN